MPADFALLTVVKYPEPGKVKTRLAASIGEQLACELYRYFIELTLACARQVPQVARYVAFSPAEREEDFRALFNDDSHWFPQTALPSLGEKLHHAMSLILQRGHHGVITIGSDSPSLPLAYLQGAVTELAARDLVLGPAEDGGYYLIGLKSAPRALFENIAWSTDRVLTQTLAAARKAGLSVALLPKWYDIDDTETLRKFCSTHAFPAQFPLDFVTQTVNFQGFKREPDHHRRM